MVALEALARHDPRKIEIHLELLRAAHSAGDPEREQTAYQRAIEQYFRQGSPETAMQLYEEMRDRGIHRTLSRAVRIRVAKEYERTQQEGRACIEYERIHAEDPWDATGVQALLGHANLMVRLGQREPAVALFEKAREAGGVHSGVGAAIREGLERAAALPEVSSHLLVPARHPESVELDPALVAAVPEEVPRVRTALVTDDDTEEPLLAQPRTRTQPILRATSDADAADHRAASALANGRSGRARGRRAAAARAHTGDGGRPRRGWRVTLHRGLGSLFAGGLVAACGGVDAVPSEQQVEDGGIRFRGIDSGLERKRGRRLRAVFRRGLRALRDWRGRGERRGRRRSVPLPVERVSLQGRDFRNFELRLSFRFERPVDFGPGADETFTGNSGYFVYLEPPHAVWPRCLEVQGSYLETGDVFGLPGQSPGNDAPDLVAQEQARRPVGEWNDLVVLSNEGALEVDLNGRLVNTSVPSGLTEGLIAFESEGADIDWRDVRIRRLP